MRLSVTIVFAHLLDANDLESFSLKREDQPEVTGQVDCPLVGQVAFKLMAMQTGESLEFLDAASMLDDIDSLDVATSHLRPISLHGVTGTLILTLELVRSEADLHIILEVVLFAALTLALPKG
jgi:hypothetical protein